MGRSQNPPATNLLNMRAGFRLQRLDLFLFVDNLLSSHPQLSLEHANPGDPRFQGVTFRPLTYG